MRKSAKIFINGRILLRKLDTWDDFLSLLEQVVIPKDFMVNREDLSPQDRKLF